MKLVADVDIDLADRAKLLSVIKHTPAAMLKVEPNRKHATGVYVTDIPYDPLTDMASIDYEEAEKRGYFKLDLLNMHVYDQVQSEEHLVRLMRDPDWSLLRDKRFVSQLVHLSNHYDSIRKMPEPINSIPRLAMFLAVIRPSKKHLVGLPWSKIAKTVWDKDDTGYSFKKSHSLAYAQLVVVHMNLLEKQRNADES